MTVDEGRTNHCWLRAKLVEKAALRFTPAGLPALDVQLNHASRLQEAGVSRDIELNIRAVALGQVAERLDQLELGSLLSLQGFLANYRRSRTVILHIQEFNQTSH